MVGGCPSDVRNLRFPVGQRPGDGYIDSPVPGVTPLIEGAKGELLLQEEALEPAISVAAGNGFASTRRLVEHAIAIDGTVGMHFFRVETASPGSRLGQLCRAWGDVLDEFVYRYLEPDASMVDVLKAVAGSCGNPAKTCG